MIQKVISKRRLTVFFIVLFLIFILCIPFHTAVVFEKEGNILSFFPIKEGETFQIRYIHSIHLSEVRETYKIIKNHQFQQTELMYEDTSIGMPAHAEKNEKFIMKDGKYYITGMKKVFQNIQMSTSRVVISHELIFKGKICPLENVIPPGTIVKIHVKRLSLLQLCKGVNMIGK
ncbi:hypothetical protein J2S13_002049 [Oikeobacillus pervagus]|uniref:DUF1850 domain-containing protein n=1 Tax=Oikeobacillus pervagus TaxID=1325931 RepID=A0AAJ1T5J4_9BACI|nr:DUF1850 domain-containing protein [Oikeobacillus pervagus]MDQ0215631.1 hypothetical protein [Oikeobacillus pervagus]